MSQYAILRRLALSRAWCAVWLFLLLALVCPRVSALDPNWNLYQFGHRAWKIDDGYLNGPVYALTQDKDGYLWLGTGNGLFRFDGVHFTAWNPPGDAPSPGYVLSLQADRDGSLWIGSIDGLIHWDHHRITHYKAGENVYSLLQDENGAVWFAPYSFKEKSEDVFCKVASEKLTCFGKKDGLPPPIPIETFARDASGTLWQGRSDAILRWKQGVAKVYDLKSLKNNANQSGVTSLAVDTDDSLFVGIGKRGPGMGLQRFHNGEWSTVTAPGFEGSGHQVSSLYFDRHHSLWIGTMDEGVYRLYQGRIDHFGHTDGLSGDLVRGIYEDREGSIWVNTSEGLDQFRDLPIRSFSRAVYPKASEFDNVVTLPDGTMWVGGAGALYTLPKGGIQFIPQSKGIAGKQVTTIFGDRSRRVWVGLDNSLNLFSNGRFIPVKMEDGRPVGFIVSMAEDAAGSLFAITTGPPRTLLSIDAKTLKASAVLPTVSASKIAGDPRQGIWIGTNAGGLQYFSKGTITSYALTPEPGNRIEKLAVDPSGEVMASGDFGLAFVKGGVVHILGKKNGLPCAFVNSFLFDTSGNLWLYTPCGLVRLSATEFQTVARRRHRTTCTAGLRCVRRIQGKYPAV